MQLTKFGVKILVCIVLLSIFVAKVSNIIAVSSGTNPGLKNKKNKNANSDNVIVKDSLDNLIWFVQISDIHISIFHDQSRITELQEFCDVTIDTVKPIVVLASGDLTDAKHVDNIGSSQFEDEWKHYKNTLDRCNISKKTVWLDVRGNHDNFNVPGPISKENYYRSYSVQGAEHPRSYLHQIKDKNGNLYSFIGLDACLEPGPRRPFNFMGLLTQNELLSVEQLAKKASSSNTTVWFGHYPTSCILSSNSIEGGVRSLIGDGGTAYLCGHLHTLAGVVTKMYTIQKNGFLELELGDWKDNRMYRVGAIDHELFSFVDMKHREWPVVLVTNPKNALFTVPSKEPLHRMGTSTHIRIIVFSVDEVVSVKIRFPGKDWIKCKHSKGPLYVYPWNPLLYGNGLHNFQVEVIDSQGREKTIEHVFSLDGSRPSFAVMPRLILMSDINLVFHVLFGLAVIGCVLPLCIVRCLNHAVRVKCIIRPRFNHFFIQKIIRKLWILSNIDLLFYSLTVYPLYLSIGPWAVGEIIEDYVGVIFVWGTFVNGGYLPGSFTYAYGFAQLVLFHFPLVLYLSHHLDRRLRERSISRSKAMQFVVYVWQMFPFFLIMILQLLFTYSFWLEYGSMAVFFGPLRFWSIIYALWLVYYAHKIPEATIRNAARLLYSNSAVTVTVTPCEEDDGIVHDLKASNCDEINDFDENDDDICNGGNVRSTICPVKSVESVSDFLFFT